jgi:hypothetical protein
LLGEFCNFFEQIPSERAANAPVLHLDDSLLLLNDRRDEGGIDLKLGRQPTERNDVKRARLNVHRAHIVDDYGDPQAVVLVLEDVFEESRFSTTEEAAEDGDRQSTIVLDGRER